MHHYFFSLIVSASFIVSPAFAQTKDFVHYGNFNQMMHTGDTKGQVSLSKFSTTPGTWGVGALAGLKGEVIQVDGKLWVSLGQDPKGRVQAPAQHDSAVLWASGQVKEWDVVNVPTDMSQPEFEGFVEQQATQRKIDLSQPFVYRVTGNFKHLIWHVVTGESPSSSSSKHDSHHSSATAHSKSAHSGHGGHANKQSGMKLFRNPEISGQFVGVYSGNKLEGIVSHPGEKFHVHYIDNELKVSGHVDQYSVKAGSMLLLPKTSQLTQHQQHSNQHSHQRHAPYAGFQNREIKALSAQQVADLKAGKGMSLALPAELNGYPGPAHTLELANELKLTAEQKKRVQALFDAMSKEAKALGLEVIEAEKKLDDLFKNKTVNAKNLMETTLAAANAQAKLRESHLRYHLDTVQVLNGEQIAAYNKMRGY